MATLEEIRRGVSVPAALELLGVELPDRVPGLICCPVHDDSTPSLNVDDDVWYCHGCGQGGGVIEFVMFAGGVSFHDACLYLEGGCELEDRPPVERKARELPDFTAEYEKARVSKLSTWEGGSFVEWCEEKWPQWPLRTAGVTSMPDEIIDRGWAKLAELNLWIPHYDTERIVRGVKLRVMNIRPYGKKNALTGSYFSGRLYRVVDRPFAPLAYLVEGETDTWTMSMHFLDRPDVAVYGMPSGVATWKSWFAPEINRHGACVVCFDNDEAGNRGYQKAKRSLDYCTRQILPVGANDVTEAFAMGWRPQR